MRYNVKANSVGNILTDINVQFINNHAHAMAKAVVDNAPVSTGALKGSITLSVNQPDVQFGEKDKTGITTKAAIDDVVINEGDEVFITAGAPYALYVEQGTSKVAPTGFMRLAIADTQRLADEAARKL